MIPAPTGTAGESDMAYFGPFAPHGRSRQRPVGPLPLLFSPIPLMAISGIIYTIFLLGEIPQSPDYDKVSPFHVAAEKANGTPLTISRRTVEIMQLTRPRHNRPFFGDTAGTYPDGSLSISFESSQPIRQTFRFAIGEPNVVRQASLEFLSREGGSESAFIPLADSTPSNGNTPTGMFPGVWMERGRGAGDFTAVTIPVDEPAGQYTLRVDFDFDVESVTYRQGWGKSIIYLDIGDAFVQPEDITSEIRYYEFNDQLTLSAPVPNAESAAPRSLVWRRENGALSVQFVAEDDFARFFMNRVADMAILVFGAALGTVISRPRRPADYPVT